MAGSTAAPSYDGPMSRPSPAQPAADPVTPWDHVLHDFLVDLFAASPVSAGFAGYHLVDDRWPDLSEAGRLARLAMLDRHAAAVAALDDAGLTPDERIDRAILDGADRAGPLLRRRPARRGVGSADGRLPAGQRPVRAARPRLRALERARRRVRRACRGAAGACSRPSIEALTGLPGRPVSLLHLDTALAQLSGIDDLIDEGLAEARTRAEAGDAPELVARIEAAAATREGGARASSAPTSTRTSDRRHRARVAWVPSCSPRSCATRCRAT